MKKIKYSLVCALLLMSMIFANAQGISNFNEATFFKAKYRKDKVWDVQRSPAFPVAGQEWTLSGLKDAFDAKGGKIDWGNDRYLMLVAEEDNLNSPNSLTDDVLKTNKKYNVSLQLFESNGTLVKIISKWGKIAGIGEKGFMYEEEGHYGTFFSVAAVPSSTVIKYKPSKAVISKMSEIVNSSDLTRSLEKANGITDCAFFNAKYTKESVWDVQRSPAYPVAGKEWTLSGLKGALESTGASIDWGTGRYLMLVPEVDNTNNTNSLIDDIINSGTKLNISLKLFESDGRLVKVVSKWGKLYGRGDKGFMYEEEGRYGTFFSVALVRSSTIIKYTPSLAAVTKLSELVNSSDLSQSLEKSNNIRECIFFNARYVKENVWDVQRSPAYPLAGKEWNLSGLKGALDNTGASIDWGTGRYLMLVAEVDNANNANSIIDDINNIGTKLNISLKLFEKDGRLVKVVSKWGKLYGRGNKGFMYETEGRYGTFFSVALVNSSTVIKYIPSLAAVTKLSELVNSSDLTKGIENEIKKHPEFKREYGNMNENGSKIKRIDENDNGNDLRKVKEDNRGEGPNKQSGTSFNKVKYTKDMVWQVNEDWNLPDAGTVRTLNIKGRANENRGPEGDYRLVDWGQKGNRYMMINGSERDNYNAEDGGIPIDFTVSLYEPNGTLVKELYREGVMVGFGDKGFEFQMMGGLVIFFSKKALKETDVINNNITIPKVEKLSQLGK